MKTRDASPRKRMSTRDAVETAIDLSKRDKSSTWEDLAIGRIARWESDNDQTLRHPENRGSGKRVGCVTRKLDVPVGHA